jgi:high-affinity iron transporter
MLLTSVIIILREFLEAAIIISVLLALGNGIPRSRRWVISGVGIGLVGAAAYAAITATVSDWLEGVGQEVVNASMQITIYCCLTLIALLVTKGQGKTVPLGKNLLVLMGLTVTLAIIREGSEILIYVSSFVAAPELLQPILLGGVVGAGIGASVGALTYYLLVSINRRWSPTACVGIILLIAAGMASQATLLLIQADWLPSQIPLWDSSVLISENSVAGQLLYALVGYEATPTPIQVAVYFGSLILPLALILIIRTRLKR